MQNMKISKLIFGFFALTIIIVFLVSCAKPYDNLDKPTSEFYINDAADALLQSTKWFIYQNGETYYDDTSLEDVEMNIRGTQIVVATYLGDSSEIDTTSIFNSYGVGNNNLGIMIFMFYEQNPSGEKEFVDLIFEIGTEMSSYLSAFEASQLIDTYFYDDSLLDVEQGIISLYYELIVLTADRIYGWSEAYIESVYYTLYDYIEQQYDIVSPLPSEDTIWGFSLEPYQIVIIIIVIIIIFGAGGRFFIPLLLSMLGRSSNRGGGGSSFGYWFKK